MTKSDIYFLASLVVFAPHVNYSVALILGFCLLFKACFHGLKGEL